MFGLILGEIGAIEAQKVRWADSTPPLRHIDGPESLPWLGLSNDIKMYTCDFIIFISLYKFVANYLIVHQVMPILKA